jgi:ParB family chromosome partitioning protein
MIPPTPISHTLHLPLAAIDPNALPRDRTTLDPTALTELRLSIATHGLRTPVEVFATDHGYALISGFRRLAAFQALHALTEDPRYATIPATLRTPETLCTLEFLKVPSSS